MIDRRTFLAGLGATAAVAAAPVAAYSSEPKLPPGYRLERYDAGYALVIESAADVKDFRGALAIAARMRPA